MQFPRDHGTRADDGARPHHAADLQDCLAELRDPPAEQRALVAELAAGADDMRREAAAGHAAAERQEPEATGASGPGEPPAEPASPRQGCFPGSSPWGQLGLPPHGSLVVDARIVLATTTGEPIDELALLGLQRRPPGEQRGGDRANRPDADPGWALSEHGEDPARGSIPPMPPETPPSSPAERIGAPDLHLTSQRRPIAEVESVAVSDRGRAPAASPRPCPVRRSAGAVPLPGFTP